MVRNLLTYAAKLSFPREEENEDHVRISVDKSVPEHAKECRAQFLPNSSLYVLVLVDLAAENTTAVNLKEFDDESGGDNVTSSADISLITQMLLSIRERM